MNTNNGTWKHDFSLLPLKMYRQKEVTLKIYLELYSLFENKIRHFSHPHP